MNPWLFVFLIAFILFLALVDLRTLVHNFWSGFVCIGHFLIIDVIAQNAHLMTYLRVEEGLPQIFIFSNTLNIFFLGITFMMAILYVQFLPKNYFLQLILASVWTFFFRLMFEIARQNNMLHFFHWKVWMLFYIIPVNMLALAWLSNILNERKHSMENEDVDRNFIK